MAFVRSGEELIQACVNANITIAEYTILSEMKEFELDRVKVIEKMKKMLIVMKESAQYGLTHETKSLSGLIGGDSLRLKKYMDSQNTLCGEFLVKAMARALSCSEVNAAMGKIVAAPTAGSCGILPAVIISAGERLGKCDEDLVNALFTSSAIGNIIAQNATLSGAEGGCQAECGSAAAMAASGVVEMMGGSVEMALHAAAIVIKNILGLVCDPIAGLVEVPCAKRNIAGTVNALTTVDLVMSGVKSKIPFDDCVEAMYRVGRSMPCELRETSLGGLATTKTGKELKKLISN